MWPLVTFLLWLFLWSSEHCIIIWYKINISHLCKLFVKIRKHFTKVREHFTKVREHFAKVHLHVTSPHILNSVHKMGCIIIYYVTNVFIAKLGTYVRSYASVTKLKCVTHELACQQWTTCEWAHKLVSRKISLPFIHSTKLHNLAPVLY